MSKEELSPELCPDGILVTKVPRLCKGGNDPFNNGFGWLVFLRADAKDPSHTDEAWLSSANKKCMQYNDDVLVPFIRKLREDLGWTPGDPVPEWMTAVSWFDGDILPQLQAMVYESRESADLADQITRNKHAASATGTQQPCDLSPVFRPMKKHQKKNTSKNDRVSGLKKIILELFSELRKKGLNLNGNRGKKNGLIDILCCSPEMQEQIMTKKHLSVPFVEAGMTDEETRVFPNFDGLVGTSKRWVSIDKDLGLPREEKNHCQNQFNALAKLWLDKGQITWSDMSSVGIPRGKLYFYTRLIKRTVMLTELLVFQISTARAK